MVTKQFLETYQLYRKLPLIKAYNEDSFTYINSPAINMFCSTCNSFQTFNMDNEYWENYANNEFAARGTDVWGKTVRAVYKCSACNKIGYTFFLEFIVTKISEDGRTYKGYVWKVGQTPAWEIDIDRNLERSLGVDAHLYKKGLVCESQSYGIGAYAYFRRITENVIDELLDSIITLIDSKEKQIYEKALEAVKKTKVTEEKIELVQDLLPISLQPNGFNPLKSLHSALSEGLHNKTDEECLELADTIKTILVYLLEEIRSRNDKARVFTTKMKLLLTKNSQSKS